MWGNLQTMTEKGEIFKNDHTKMGLLESKLSKNILVNCTFISNKLVVVIAVRKYQDLYHVNIQYIHKVKKTTTATI